MSTGNRSVLFDTETTGVAPRDGDRIIEIAALELVNDLPTGRRFHALIDPERDIPDEVSRVHGITNADVVGKPLFAEVAQQLADFFGDSKLIAHNAPFDFGFLDMELARLDRAPLCRDRMVDTLALAKARFPGTPNSLDALCRRLSIDLSARTTHHNALLDCELLAKVYLELTGGRQRGLSMAEGDSHGDSSALPYRIHDRKSAGYFRETWAGKSRAFWEAERTAFLAQRTPRPPIVPSEVELAAHAAFLADDPDKAALAEEERARAEAIKSRTEPLRLAAQAAEAAWRAFRPPAKMETKIDRGQANGELARPQDSLRHVVRISDNDPSTLPDLGKSRQRVAEWRDRDEEIAAAAPGGMEACQAALANAALDDPQGRDEYVIRLPDEAQPSAEELEQSRRNEEARQAAWLADAPRLIAAFEEHRAIALRNPATQAFLAAQQEPSTDDTPTTLAWFDRAIMEGQPAIGVQTRTTWGNITQTIASIRRERDVKDGPCFVPSRFTPYYRGDDRHVRRQRKYVQARTLIALDIETSKATGEAPPSPVVAAQRLHASGLAGVVYTSHSHTPADNRYRAVMPLSAEIPFEHAELPVAEIMAEHLGLVGVLDTSKIQGESAFYLPSSPVGAIERHQCIVVTGDPIDASWLAETAGRLLAARQAEADRIAATAHAEAAARLQARIAAGFNPDDSLIEKLRSRFDLADVLRTHRYDQDSRSRGWRHPASQSGSFGASIKTFGGIERIYSHNGTDPLHRDNLPDWCSGVTALDAFDVVTILDFGGDRDRAMRELAERFGLSKTKARKAVSALIRKLRERGAPQEAIEAKAFAEGLGKGLTREEVISVALWVVADIKGSAA